MPHVDDDRTTVAGNHPSLEAKMSLRQWFTALAVSGATLGATQNAAAQWNMARATSVGARNHLYTTVGRDDERMVSVGYQRVLPMFGQDWHFDVEAGVAAPDFDYRDFSSRLQLRTSVLHWRSLRLLGSLAGVIHGIDNLTYRGISFGADITATGGVYRPGWFVAGEFGFEKAAVTRKNFTDPNALDGWFLAGPGVFHYGASTGVAIGALEVSARAGLRYKEGRYAAPLPGYVGVGMGVRF
jgi:hypothetical protein